MRERALLLGGTLVVERGVNGVGTCVRAWIPTLAPDGNAVGEASYATPALMQTTAPDKQESLPQRAANPG